MINLFNIDVSHKKMINRTTAMERQECSVFLLFKVYRLILQHCSRVIKTKKHFFRQHIYPEGR